MTLPFLKKTNTELFRSLRDEALVGGINLNWPLDTLFNWAIDWFDQIRPANRRALSIVYADCVKTATYEDLTIFSNRISNQLGDLGIRAGDRVLVLMRNSIEYYALSLALMKVGAVMIPSFVSVTASDLADRVHYARIQHIVSDVDVIQLFNNFDVMGIKMHFDFGESTAFPGWHSLTYTRDDSIKLLDRSLGAPNDPMMGFFTSGTTARPKLVFHSYQSYPIGHLYSLGWQGISTGDVHMNISSPGWAKHAWSSFFVPFSAESELVVFNADQPDPSVCTNVIEDLGITSFCAPPSYWRSIERAGPGPKPRRLTNITSAGESLDETTIEKIFDKWGLHIRDGYGQSEITALIGFSPKQERVEGALGYALQQSKGIKLVDPQTGIIGDEGEIKICLSDRPISLMLGYVGEDGEPHLPFGQYYCTGDLARRDSNGCYFLLGRTNDIFKSYDIRISPIEIECTLREHPLLREVAVFASTDENGELVPALAAVLADKKSMNHMQLINEIYRWQRDKLSPYQHIKSIWFMNELPRTISGKINRSKLRDKFTHCKKFDQDWGIK